MTKIIETHDSAIFIGPVVIKENSQSNLSSLFEIDPQMK